MFRALNSEKPPKMTQKPKTFSEFSVKREDPYFWFRNQEDPEVMSHLEAENNYFEKHLEKYKEHREKLFEEMKNRDPKVLKSTPERLGDYFYQERYPEGADHVQLTRFKQASPEEVEVLFDLNKELLEHKNRDIQDWAISDDHSKIVLCIDLDGSEFGHVYYKELSQKKLIETPIKTSSGILEWDHFGEKFFWVELSKNWRPFRACAYSLKTEENKILFEEKDSSFFVSLYRSTDDNYLFVSSQSQVGSDSSYIDLRESSQKLNRFHERYSDILIDLDHHPKLGFIAQSNHKNKNFSLFKVKPESSYESWQLLFDSSDQTALSDYAMAKGHFVLSLFEKGLPKIVLLCLDSLEVQTLNPPREGFWVKSLESSCLDKNLVLVKLSSMIDSSKSYELEPSGKTWSLYHEIYFEGGFNPEFYETKVIYCKSHDGFTFPVSLSHKKGLDLSTPKDLVLYGYGSYGMEMRPTCIDSSFCLLDRDFIFAIAHIRGGGEHGQKNMSMRESF